MLPAVRRDPTAVFMRAAGRFGDVVYLKIGPRRGFLITNPADVRHVLQDNARNYHKSPLYAKLRMSLGNGLLTSEDDFWLRQRRIAQPAFHRQRLVGLAATQGGAMGAHNASSAVRDANDDRTSGAMEIGLRGHLTLARWFAPRAVRGPADCSSSAPSS
jgi:cytochrome P450